MLHNTDTVHGGNLMGVFPIPEDYYQGAIHRLCLSPTSISVKEAKQFSKSSFYRCFDLTSNSVPSTWSYFLLEKQKCEQDWPVPVLDPYFPHGH